MSKYYMVSISVEKVLSYEVYAKTEEEAEREAIRKLDKSGEDYAIILDSDGAIEAIVAGERYEVAISVDKVLTYVVQAEDKIGAEHEAVRKLKAVDEDYATILNSDGGIDEITEAEYHAY